MTAKFYVRMERAGQGVAWWAETPDVEGLSIAADSLAQLRNLIAESVALHLGGEVEVDLILVAEDDEPDSDAPFGPDFLTDTGVVGNTAGPEVRRTLVRVS